MQKVGLVPARPYLCALIPAGIKIDLGSGPWDGVDSLNKGNLMRNRIYI